MNTLHTTLMAFLLLAPAAHAENRYWGWDFDIVGVNAEGPMEVGSEMTLKVTVENNSYAIRGNYGTVVVALEITPPSGSTSHQEKTLYDTARNNWGIVSFKFTPAKEGTHKIRITVLNPDKNHIYDEETNSFFVDKKKLEAPKITGFSLVSDGEKLRVSYTHPGADHYYVYWGGCGSSDEKISGSKSRDFFMDGFPASCRVEFKARAYLDGYSPWSAAAYYTTPVAKVPPPAAPSAITYAPVDSQTLRVTIAAVSGAERYRLEMLCGGERSVNDHSRTTNEYPMQSCSDWTFRAAAINAGGSSPWSASFPVNLTLPEAPEPPEETEEEDPLAAVDITDATHAQVEYYFFAFNTALQNAAKANPALNDIIIANLKKTVDAMIFHESKSPYTKGFFVTDEASILKVANYEFKLRLWKKDGLIYPDTMLEDALSGLRYHYKQLTNAFHVEEIANGHKAKYLQATRLSQLNGGPITVIGEDLKGLIVTNRNPSSPSAVFDILVAPEGFSKKPFYDKAETVAGLTEYWKKFKVRPVKPLGFMKQLQVFEYLRKGGVVLATVGCVIAVAEVSVALAQGDYESALAITLATGVSYAFSTAAGAAVAVLCVPATAETGPAVPIICGGASLGAAVLAGYLSYTLTDDFVRASVENTEHGLAFTMDKAGWQAFWAEHERLLREEYGTAKKALPKLVIQAANSAPVIATAVAPIPNGAYKLISKIMDISWQAAATPAAAQQGRNTVTLTVPLQEEAAGRLTALAYNIELQSWQEYPVTAALRDDLARFTLTAPQGIYALGVRVQAVNGTANVSVYPVPFRPRAGHSTITFAGLPADTELSIYTLQGLLVKKLSGPVNGTLEWTPAGIQSGVYIYSVRAGGAVKNGKLIIIR